MRRLGVQRRGGAQSTPVNPVAVRVEISLGETVNLLVGGGTYAPAAIFYDVDSNAITTGYTAVWSSDDVAVFTVNSSTGVVTPVGAGSAALRVKDTGNSVADTQLIVVAAAATPASIEINLASIALTTGQVQILTATVRDAGGTVLGGQTVTWTSLNTGFVTVTADSGDPSHQTTATGIAAGSTSIRAACGAFTAVCPVTVTTGVGAGPIVNIDFNYANTAAFIGDRSARGNWAQGKTWGMGEDTIAAADNINPAATPTGYITLENDACPGSVTGKCMRFTYPVEGLSVKAHRRAPIMPGNSQYKEMWLQWYEKHSTVADGVPAFDTDSDPITNGGPYGGRLYGATIGKSGSADWKHMLVSLNGQAAGDPDSLSRSGYEIGNQPGKLCNVYGVVSQTNPTFQITQPTFQGGSNTVWFNGMKLGGWHKFQMYLRVSTSYTLTSGTADGAAVAFFDGQYVLGAMGMVVKRSFLLYPRFGDTFNLGIDANHKNMWVQYAGIKIWANATGTGTGSPLWGYTALGVAVP